DDRELRARARRARARVRADVPIPSQDPQGRRRLRRIRRKPVMIRTTLSDGVAEIVLNAPDRLNALHADDIAAPAEPYRAAEESGARALLLRGEGRAFCAGRDITNVDPRTDDVEGFLGGLVTPLLKRMAAFPAPTFAVAHGACLGVGLGLLIATDVVYVADTAKIGSPFGKLGATLDSGGHALFFERLGAHKTL